MNDPKTPAVGELHGCHATHLRSKPVTERFRGETIWDGIVEVFSITGRDAETTAHGWAYGHDDGKVHHLALLGGPPSKSAMDALRAAAVAAARRNL